MVLSTLAQAHGRWMHWLGALPARRVVWVAACLFCAWVVADVLVLRLTSGVSHSSYDLMVRSRLLVAAPDPRILIIDVDETSLKRMAPEFGRWPWPRDTLATLLDYLEAQAPAAIVWDIQFSDADRISPGGDAAFDAAVGRSPHSHFSVARLMASTDHVSQISSAVLPALWVLGDARKPQTSTVSLIPPALPAVAAAKLGYNNGVVDADGVLRRYRAFEVLPDGSAIQSIAMSVLAALQPEAYGRALKDLWAGAAGQAELIDWNSSSKAYPHIPFADVFDAADTGRRGPGLPPFAGKILIIGSTAASLHDIHPTPISPDEPGVDSLATVLDNALNARHIHELPRWLDAAIAMALCLGMSAWVLQRRTAWLGELTLVLPLLLLALSYATLNGSGVFVDLNLSAALVLLYLAFLAYWNQQRRLHWCDLPAAQPGPLLLWPLAAPVPWLEFRLDRLIDRLESHSSLCRLVVPDIHLSPFQQLRWPELALQAALLGPQEEVLRIQAALAAAITDLAAPATQLVELPGQSSRQQIARAARQAWADQDASVSGDRNT